MHVAGAHNPQPNAGAIINVDFLRDYSVLLETELRVLNVAPFVDEEWLRQFGALRDVLDNPIIAPQVNVVAAYELLGGLDHALRHAITPYVH